MAHELDFTTGEAALAYVGETPWHGYGKVLQPGAAIEVWRINSGLDWIIVDDKIYDAYANTISGYKSLHRSDTGSILSVVSERYKVVQPAEVLEFFRDLTSSHGYELESAGALRGGRRFWALAKTGNVAAILGEDEIRDYLLLSTSCDGSLATTGQYTSIRVVCNNTLAYAVESGELSRARKSRVQHSAVFDAAKMKNELATSTDHWAAFVAKAEVLAKTGISLDQAVRYFSRTLGVGETVSNAEKRKIERLLTAWTSGAGSDMASARSTLWGLVNAVTAYVDHGGSEREDGNRQNRAWFGNGAKMKADAMKFASELVA